MEQSFKGKLKDSLWYWLGKRKPFILDDEYKLELLFIDKENNSAKIKITKLNGGESSTGEVYGQKREC